MNYFTSKYTKYVLLVLLLLLFSCRESSVDPSEFYGNIYGIVYDFSTDEPLDNCTITLSPTVGSQRSRSNGVFYFSKVYADKYEIRIEKDGYRDYNGSVVVIRNERTYLNIVLKKIFVE